MFLTFLKKRLFITRLFLDAKSFFLYFFFFPRKQIWNTNCSGYCLWSLPRETVIAKSFQMFSVLCLQAHNCDWDGNFGEVIIFLGFYFGAAGSATGECFVLNISCEGREREWRILHFFEMIKLSCCLIVFGEWLHNCLFWSKNALYNTQDCIAQFFMKNH